MDTSGKDLSQPDFSSLAARFLAPGVVALVLMGSHARGDAGPYSDIDLVRFYSQNSHGQDNVGPGTAASSAETYLLGGHFVVVSDVYPEHTDDWFQKPDQASATIAGLRSARPLWDPDGFFAAIQTQARAFTWDAAMQARADAWVSSQMVGWIEEVQKGLAGLRTGHEGRLLNARYGLTWGMVNVLRVQRGILISGDNGVYPEVVDAVGSKSRWAVLSRQAYGIDGGTLQAQVVAGMRLYIQTAELVAHALRPEDQPLIDEVVRRIKAELHQNGQH